jgi:hypothetical protein
MRGRIFSKAYGLNWFRAAEGMRVTKFNTLLRVVYTGRPLILAQLLPRKLYSTSQRSPSMTG